jgi:hypothetical protein
VSTLVTATPARAQIDYRNLDDDRPARVEDAYPAERYAFELLVPYTFERKRGGETVHASILELEYGMAANTHVGIKAPLAARREAGNTTWGLSGLRVFGLYNFNTEGPLLPAFAVRADVTLPVGSVGPSDAGAAVKAVVTRSWGRSRVHVNAAYRLGPDGTPAAVESADRWWAGAAVDRTVFRHSVLLIGEVYAAQAATGAPVAVNASAGFRWQWRPTAVLDFGVARRIREDLGPDIAVTFGVSKAFAIAGLMPGGR